MECITNYNVFCISAYHCALFILGEFKNDVLIKGNKGNEVTVVKSDVCVHEISSKSLMEHNTPKAGEDPVYGTMSFAQRDNTA